MLVICVFQFYLLGFLTKVLETFELIFSGKFCTLMYFNKWIKKHKKAAFSLRLVRVIQTPCVGINFSYCRESRELFFEKHLIQPLIHLLLHIRAVVALNNCIPGSVYPFHLPWGQTQVVHSKTCNEDIFFIPFFPYDTSVHRLPSP